MNPIQVVRLAATTLVILLPLAAYSAEAVQDKAPTESAALSAEDLAAIAERIRQTGAQMRVDFKEARARLDSQKADQEAERKREAKKDVASQAQAQRDAELQSEFRKRQALQATQRTLEARNQADLERQQSLAKLLSAQEEKQLAKQRSAEALQNARQSAGVQAFADGNP